MYTEISPIISDIINCQQSLLVTCCVKTLRQSYDNGYLYMLYEMLLTGPGYDKVILVDEWLKPKSFGA